MTVRTTSGEPMDAQILLVGWKDILSLLRVSRWTARRWARHHGLPIVYRGRTPTITLDRLIRWLERQKKRPDAPSCSQLPPVAP